MAPSSRFGPAFRRDGEADDGPITLPPGVVTDVATHPGDLVGLVTDGWAGVFEDGRSERVELRREDGVLIPGGTSYRLMNMTDRLSEFVFGAARLADARHRRVRHRVVVPTASYPASEKRSRSVACAVANSSSVIERYGDSIRNGKSPRPALSFAIVLS